MRVMTNEDAITPQEGTKVHFYMNGKGSRNTAQHNIFGPKDLQVEYEGEECSFREFFQKYESRPHAGGSGLNFGYRYEGYNSPKMSELTETITTLEDTVSTGENLKPIFLKTRKYTDDTEHKIWAFPKGRLHTELEKKISDKKPQKSRRERQKEAKKSPLPVQNMMHGPYANVKEVAAFTHQLPDGTYRSFFEIFEDPGTRNFGTKADEIAKSVKDDSSLSTLEKLGSVVN